MTTKIVLPYEPNPRTQYYTKNNKIYFNNDKIEMKKADFDTFELHIGWFAKDKNHCYLNGAICKESDVATFEVLSWAFAKDKNNVYSNKGVIKDADPKTFEVIGSGLIKSNVEWSVTPFGYARDKNYVYLYIYGTKTIKIKDADLATFVHVNELFAKDKNFVYWNGKKLKNVNPETWRLLSDDSSYSTDDKNAYCGAELIKGVDIETFELFVDKSNHYARDKNYIYNHSLSIGVSSPDWSFNTDEVKAHIKMMHPKYYAKWYKD